MPKMTDEERQELAAKMDKDMETFVEQKIKESKERKKDQPEEKLEDIDVVIEVSLELIFNDEPVHFCWM